ncbi:UNVERIFIED_CONTAM: hypothetical protein B566_EDAN019173 [Ephemera danica]|nr:hypothetical protein B566_EDAN019173 [Ephemera danica]
MPTCCRPMLIEDKEVSVYDLKDHPDFQYRPGTVVIRVANFEGEDALCTAGQVLDNFPEGQVQVWWVDNHVSMCWPQDLYKVGEYDSDEGELWDDAGSDASWETQSEEDCYIADVSCHDDETNESLKPKLGANIEKARIAMSRLEEIFTQNPALQTSGVMRQLLDVYKDCRYLDKLMGTSFFHESHFQGLLERVREKGRANLAQRVADQVSRLFRTGDKDAGRETASSVTPSSSESVRATDDSGVYIFNKDSGSSPSESLISGEFLLSENLANLERQVAAAASAEDSISPLPPKSYAEAAKQGTQQEDLPSVNVCVKLCSLIKEQLLKALTEVTARFGGQVSLSRAQLAESPEHKHGIDTTVVGTAPLVTLEDFEEPEQAMEATALPNGPTEQKILGEGFVIEATAPSNHKFVLTMFEPIDFKLFLQTVKKEHKLLNTSLPSGICVKGFEDRMVNVAAGNLSSTISHVCSPQDLYSVMIKGPAKTPYEDGLFFFDFQLSSNYPKAPPVCHYVSYCNDRLNPNLYEDGKVCISLLGTWSGKGTEVWTLNSTLLQVIVSIQGLILVSEPYFNEAGYERQKGSQQGRENSRMYNEMVVLKQVQALSKMLLQPPPIFKQEIMDHFRLHAFKLIHRLETWLQISEVYNNTHPLSPTTPTTFKQVHGEVVSSAANMPLPEFPLIPASKGFCLTLRKTLVSFRDVLSSVGIQEPAASAVS